MSGAGILPTLMHEMTLCHQRSSGLEGLKEPRNVRNIGGTQQQLFNSLLLVASH